MFKPLGQLIHKTPWWGLILMGFTVLAALVLFATPVQVLRLSDSGNTPQEQRAIKREIQIAFGDSALNMAEEVVSAMRHRSSDADRTAEFDRALAEISRAREELTRAHNGQGDDAQDAARDARLNALEAAHDAAQAAIDAAVEARQAIEESRDEATAKLKDKGVDISATVRSFEDLITAAHSNEKTAREALQAIVKLQTTKEPNAPRAPAISIKIDNNGPPTPALPPEVRGKIHSKVAGDVWRIGVGSVLILAFIPLFIMLLVGKYFIGRSYSAMAFAEEKEKQAVVSDVSRQITEARLQALQAQVEPHFLYNTLANVQALTEVDPPAANQMVGHLIQYLRSALPKMRESTSTVGQEIELVRAYLNILQMRMGTRLTFSVEAPNELLGSPFPPLMLPSLVENAIKHGLEPIREGGHIDVVVSKPMTEHGERICVQVKDTGRGLTDAPMQAGGGVGLSNLRERLQAIYGGRASFAIESNTPQGVVASICVPCEAPAAAASANAHRHQDPLPDTPTTLAASGWRKVRSVTSKTHSAWTRIVSRTFLFMMVALLAMLILALVGLYTGWLPMQMGDLQLDGLEGMALGSVGLLIAFSAAAFAAAVVVAVLYGLGFLLVGLLFLIPAIMLISLFPFLLPLALIGVVFYIFWRRKQTIRRGRNMPR
jgi:hypothetical protein